MTERIIEKRERLPDNRKIQVRFSTSQQYETHPSPFSVSTIEYTRCLSVLTYKSYRIKTENFCHVFISVKKIECERYSSLTSRTKEMACLSVIKSNGKLRWLYEKIQDNFPGQSCVRKTLYYGRKIWKNGLQSRADIKKSPEAHWKNRKKRTTGSQATFGTGTITKRYHFIQTCRKQHALYDERLH